MSKYVNLTKDEIDQINSFQERYEFYLDKKGYSISRIKEEADRIRENIFQRIEQNIEKNGYYDLKRIIEALKPGIDNNISDADKVVLSFPVPEIVSMFIPRRKRNDSKRINSIKKKQKIPKQNDYKDIDHETNIEMKSNDIKTEDIAISEALDSNHVKMKVDMVEVKQYISELKQNRVDLLNAFYKFLLYVFLFASIIIIGISIDAVFNNNLSCRSTNINFEYLIIRTNLRCTYFEMDFFEIYLIYMYIALSYFSLLLLKIIFTILINYSIGLKQDEVAEIVILLSAEVPVSKIMEKKGLVYKLIYNGIISIKED